MNNFNIDDQISVTLLGKCGGRRMYGYINRQRIIVFRPDGMIGDKLSEQGSGSHVSAVVTGFQGGTVLAEVIECYDTFIDKNVNVRLTGQSTLDARDSVSSYQRGHGIYGTTAIVKRYTPATGRIYKGDYDCFVKIKSLEKGKSWRPIIMTELDDIGLENDYSDVIYVLDWPPGMKHPRGSKLPTGKKPPNVGKMKNWKIGIPPEVEKALYYGNKETMIVDEGGDHKFISRDDAENAVEIYFKACGGNKFRLALAIPERMGELRHGIKEHEKVESSLPIIPKDADYSPKFI